MADKALPEVTGVQSAQSWSECLYLVCRITSLRTQTITECPYYNIGVQQPYPYYTLDLQQSLPRKR
jgi:hypothetical protein